MAKKVKKIQTSTLSTREKSLEAMLELICEYHDLEEIRTLYGSIGDVLEKEFSSSPLIIMSKPMETSDPQYLRNHWNKSKISHYPEKELEQFLNVIKKESNGFKGYKKEEISSHFYYGVPFGHQADQFYFGIWKTKINIPEEFLDYLVKFISTTHIMMSKWNEISKIKDLIYRDDVTNLFNQRKKDSYFF